MEVEQKHINKSMILVFLLCNELGLDFNAMKSLYIYHSNIFWNFIYVLFPALKISIKKFNLLESLACSIFSKLNDDSLELKDSNDINMYHLFKHFIKDKYELADTLLTKENMIDIINKNKDQNISITLGSGKILNFINRETFKNNIVNTVEITIKEDVYKLTSSFKHRILLQLNKDPKQPDLKKIVKGVLKDIKKEIGFSNED